MLLQDTARNQAAKRPEATALVSSGTRVSYGELDTLTNRLARLLQWAGCKKGDRVAILLPKSIEAIAGLLGTLKAGCVYVPMDTSSPSARLAHIVRSCEPQCILAVESVETLLADLQKEVADETRPRVGWLSPGKPKNTDMEIAFSREDLSSASAASLECSTQPECAAHILFTSGSTGIPKGVVITHSNVTHFIEWATKYFGTSASDKISCHPPLHFDLSTFDIYGTFLAGAELHLVPPEASLLPKQLANFIRQSQLTQWFSVPSVFKYMAQFEVIQQGDFPSLRRVLWCGEALPTPTLIYWMKRVPHAKFTNLYGPTEATIASSYYTVPACPDDPKADISIGRPCAGEDLMVLDEALKPLPAGEVGDLYIRGVGLSPGYWKDPQKTAAAFLEQPGLGRIYKTGDLARTGADGLIYLLGRADSQIKSRGYRIELGEIETALNSLGLLKECAVVGVQSDGFEGTAICCAYVPADGKSVSAVDLREHLLRALPPYMIPAQWMEQKRLPLNANGKVDRPRLREQFKTETKVAKASQGS